MRMSRVPAAVSIAVAGLAGLTACAGTGPSSSAAASAPASSASAAVVPSASAKSRIPAGAGTSATPAISVTPVRTASAKPSSSATAASSGTQTFAVPAISGDNVVSAYGSYAKTGARVKVTVCAKQTGKAFSVGAIALAYNASGASKNIGAVVLTGPGTSSCGTTTFLFYTAHLKVHAFIGNNGTIVKTGPVLTLY